MKRIITSLLALLAVASCTKESIESYPSSGEVTFTTKANVTRANEKNTWIGGDEIGIYAGDKQTNLQYNASIDGSTVNFTPDGDAVGYTNESTPTTFYAYYPFNADATTTTVPFDLAALTDGLLKQVDMLWSSAKSTKSDNDASIDLQFDHVHSIIEITVARGADLSEDDFDKLEVELLDSYTAGNLDITSGETTYTGSESFNLVEYAVNDDIYMMSGIVMAHDYDTADKDITLTFSVGEDAVTRTFTETLSPKWEAGHKYRYVAKVGNDDITFIAGSITAWGDEVSDNVVATSAYDIIINSDDVFEIYTAKGLAAFRDLVMGLTDNSDAKIVDRSGNEYKFDGTANLTINGKLMKDINLVDICNETAGSWTPIGKYPNDQYAGTFDGNGNEVQGLYINTTGFDQGLFSIISDEATIKNLGVRGCVSSTQSEIGGLVGYNYGGTIDYCYSAVTVIGESVTGGLVGLNTGKVINCYNTGSVTGSGIFIGGLVGACNPVATIANCYNRGDVKSSNGSQIGGIVGYITQTSVTNCYSAAAVSGKTEVGGVVGCVYDDQASITNCYYNTNYFGGAGLARIIQDCSVETQITGYSTAYMKSDDFVTTLNGWESGDTTYKEWVPDIDGFPVFVNED